MAPIAKKLEKPIILFCSERSGSNLIAKIFDAHPEVSAPGAAHLFRVMHEVTLKYSLNREQSIDSILRLFRAKVSHWEIDSKTDHQLRELLKPLSNCMEMCAALYQAECVCSQKKITLIKENSAYKYLNTITLNSNQARFLTMVRDPRDMAVSWTNSPVMRGGTVRAVYRWLSDQTGFLGALNDLERNVVRSTLRYEDLITNAEAEVRRICKELSIEFSPSMLNFAAESTSAQINATRSSMWSNLNKPILTENSQKFRQELNDNQLAFIEKLCGSLMEKFGYKECYKTGSSVYGEFKRFDDLEDYLLSQEPNEKASFYKLSAYERESFQNWTEVYQNLTRYGREL